MQIGDLSRQCGVSVRALRHYEQAGLLEAHRLPNGYRTFAEGSAARVRQIQELLRCGFDLADIRVLLPCYEHATGSLCDRASDLLVAKLAEVDARLQVLQTLRERLARRIDAAGAAD